MSFRDYLLDGIRERQDFHDCDACVSQVELAASLALKTLKNGKKILFAGNGGSAADSQHLAAEFVSRFKFDRPGLPAIALTTDTSALTAIGNDYGFEKLFSRQIEALGNPGDLFIGITTSGKSPNILEGFSAASAKGITTLLLTGDNQFQHKVDLTIAAKSNQTCLIQEMHITIGHYLCDYVERKYFA